MLPEKSPDLVRYLAEFGLALADLEPSQLSMFVAARNAAGELEGLEIPIGSKTGYRSDAELTEVEDDRALDVIAWGDATLESHLPADEMDVRFIGSAEDLPRIFPVQWLMEEVFPEWFYARLARRELLMPEWQRAACGLRDREEAAPRRELVAEPAAEAAPRLHAYVLLDTSTTMQDHDRRGTVARGLALEFLRKSYRQGARLLLRPFTVDVGELSSGSSAEDFRAITQRLVQLRNAGQTRIQTALEQAVRDIRRAGPCQGASILLITDGISRLSHNPLGRERLHTFILGDLYDEQRAAGAIGILKQWSHSFHRVWQTRFASLLAPSLADCRAAGLVLQAMLDRLGDSPAGGEADRLRRVLENTRFLVRELKRALGQTAALPPELQAFDGQLHEVEQRLAAITEQAMPASEPLVIPQRVPFARARAARNPAAIPQETIGVWEYLKLLASQVRHWLPCLSCRRTATRTQRSPPTDKARRL